MNFWTSSSSKTQLVWALLTLLTLPNCTLWNFPSTTSPAGERHSKPSTRCCARIWIEGDFGSSMIEPWQKS